MQEWFPDIIVYVLSKYSNNLSAAFDILWMFFEDQVMRFWAKIKLTSRSYLYEIYHSKGGCCIRKE